MIIRKSKRKKTNNPRWSHGGMRILDAIETESYINKGNKLTELVPIKKLFILMVKYPSNAFYKSLYKQSRKGRLSTKQVQCIVRDYEKSFDQLQKEKHLKLAAFKLPLA